MVQAMLDLCQGFATHLRRQEAHEHYLYFHTTRLSTMLIKAQRHLLDERRRLGLGLSNPHPHPNRSLTLTLTANPNPDPNPNPNHGAGSSRRAARTAAGSPSSVPSRTTRDTAD